MKAEETPVIDEYVCMFVCMYRTLTMHQIGDAVFIVSNLILSVVASNIMRAPHDSVFPLAYTFTIQSNLFGQHVLPYTRTRPDRTGQDRTGRVGSGVSRFRLSAWDRGGYRGRMKA